MFTATHNSILLVVLLTVLVAANAHVTATNSTFDDDDYVMPRLPMPKYNEQGEILFFPRIVNGTVAGLGEYPGKVSLQQRPGGNHFCGGTIIDQSHVVTAAHCVANDRNVVIAPTMVRYSSNFNLFVINLSFSIKDTSSRR